MSLNLMDKLSEQDNLIFTKYMEYYSQAGEKYCGNEVFLKEWAANKKKLYGLLGNSLKKSFPLVIQKPEKMLQDELHQLADSHSFIDLFYSILRNVRNDSENDNALFNICFNDFIRPLCKNEPTNHVLVIKNINVKRTLKISTGCSPIKAVGKAVKYITDFFPHIFKSSKDKEKFEESFEDFRQKHSMILNKKELSGNIVLSIDPIDFVTMSNNNSDWTSCMSWAFNGYEKNNKKKESGCYHAGTIEMMNSNNIICAYLESKTPYDFYTDNKTGEVYQCSNKKWRSLFIVTPEIICSGKAYPYQHEEMSIFCLEKLRELAKENKGWEYRYGIEEYNDMKHIDTTAKMNTNHSWIKMKHTTKHNIIFDTNAMYNDIFKDKNIKYFCVRNRVKKNTFINISGKALCTCCGEQTLIFPNEEYYYPEYHDRYMNTGVDICEYCRADKLERCDCYHYILHEDEVIDLGDKKICKKCFINNYKKCPTCNKYFNTNSVKYIYSYKNDYVLPAKDISMKDFNEYFACEECIANYKREHEGIFLSREQLINFTNIKYFRGHFVDPYVKLPEEELKTHSFENTPSATEENFDEIKARLESN